MVTEINPYIGSIAKDLKEMQEITEASRKYERTGESTEWRSLKTGEIIATNL